MKLSARTLRHRSANVRPAKNAETRHGQTAEPIDHSGLKVLRQSECSCHSPDQHRLEKMAGTT